MRHFSGQENGRVPMRVRCVELPSCDEPRARAPLPVASKRVRRSLLRPEFAFLPV